MRILYADTTSGHMKAALYEGDRWYEESIDSGRHSVHILGLIDSLLNRHSISIGDIDVFSVNQGPGSFTGTRVGILTMLGFSRVFGKPFVYVGAEEYYQDIADKIREEKFSEKAVALYNGMSYFEKRGAQN